MARFDVYRNPDGPGYLLDLQADLIGHLATRVVAPLLPLGLALKPARILNPVFDIGGTPVAMIAQAMAAVPVQMLRMPVASLAGRRDEVIAAMDLLFRGF